MFVSVMTRMWKFEKFVLLMFAKKFILNQRFNNIKDLTPTMLKPNCSPLFR